MSDMAIRNPARRDFIGVAALAPASYARAAENSRSRRSISPIAGHLRRSFCRLSLLVLLVCSAVPQGNAAPLHTRYISGAYRTRDEHLLRALAGRNPGTYSIDGYQMTISKQTEICWHHAILQFGAVLSKDAQPVADMNASSPCEIVPPSTLGEWVWTQYRGIQRYSDVFRPDMNVTATRVDVWQDNHGVGPGSGQNSAPAQTWQVLCASASPQELHYPDESPIDVVCDPKVNGYIENVFVSLLKPSALESSAQITKRQAPRFYVVKPFRVRHNFDFETIDGHLGPILIAPYAQSFYDNPRAHSTVRDIVYAPDGTVLIPDTALAHLHNEAECAALLSYSLAIKNQEIIEHLIRVQRFKGKARGGRNDNARYTGKYVWGLNEQVLRLGIRRMYLAGYDIREAPFAWAVAQGKRVRNPDIDSQDNGIPSWYAAYAFNDISRLYPNVHYGELKRGQAEYAAFLKELRKADPAAFEYRKN